MINKSINLLIKPTEMCNMRCKYCFHEKSGYIKGVMSEDIFDRILHLVSKDYSTLNIIWHGWEPLMVPFHFFEYAYKQCEKSNLGISFDGTVNEKQRGNTREVIFNINKMHDYGFIPAAIMVVTRNNIDRLIGEYEYFKSLNIAVKFNPMFCDGAGIKYPELEVPVNEYISRFTDFFMYWLFDNKCNINMITCHELVKLILYRNAGVCTFNSCLGKWGCIDWKGDIYPCDRLCAEKYKLANVYEIDSILDIYKSKVFYNLVQSAVLRRKQCKDDCKYYDMCYGGCNANAELFGNIRSNGNNICLMHKGILENISAEVCCQVNKLKNSSCDDERLNPKFVLLAKKSVNSK